MRDVNTLGKTFYILENIFWAALGVWSYLKFAFTNLPGFDDAASKWILYISSAVFLSLGILLTIKRRRNSVSTFVNVALPLVAYTIAAYFDLLGVLILSLSASAIILSLAYIAATKRYSLNKAVAKPRSFNFKRFIVLGARTISTCCLAILIVYIYMTTVTGFRLFSAKSENAENDAYTFEEYYLENTSTFDKLLETTWVTLGKEEKLDVLQVVCNAERAKLGISEPIQIKSSAFENDLLGEYVNSTNTVVINAKHLDKDSSYQVIKT